MDRNDLPLQVRGPDIVALRKESVDRNSTEPANLTVSTTSLSARRAWIEILESKQIDPSVMVALRKESVDRNPL